MDRNPWKSIWLHPRATIRGILAENPRKSLWLLAWIYGFTSLLNGFQSFPLAIRTGFIPVFILAVVLAPFWGYLFFAIWSWVVIFVGKLLKGRATFETARAAYAWSCVPLLANSVLWILLSVFFNQLLFFGSQTNQVLSDPAVTVLFIILIGKLVFSIWSLVLYLQTLAEVQQFSILRSIGNVILASILIGIVCILFRIIFLQSMNSLSAATTMNWIVQFAQ